jgi:hypothetical protein
MLAGLQTVAVFGDSWADSSHGHDINPNIGSEAWFNRMPGYSATSYGHAGSSLYSAWQEFLTHHSGYDRVVFIATSPLRLHLNSITHMGVTGYLAGFVGVERFINHASGEIDMPTRQRLHAMRDYYQYLQNDQVDADIAHLIIDDVRNRRPDAIIIPTGDDPIFLKNIPSLSRYLNLFTQSINLPPELIRQGLVPYFEKACVCVMLGSVEPERP